MHSYWILLISLTSVLVPGLQGHSLTKRQEEGNGQQPEAREVAPGIYSYTTGGAYISMFIVEDEGVMVIDPMNKRHAENMLVKIREVTQAPIKYLFYSHNHYDHAKGGQVFKDEGAEIISHIGAYEYIKANPSPDLVLPDTKWTGDRYSVTLGGTTLDLYYVGVSHGNGMTAFVIPREKMGYIADLVTPNQVNFFFMPDFNIPGLIAAQEFYNTLDVDRIVFSHSAYEDVLAPGSQDDIKLFTQYLKDIQAAVREKLAEPGANPFAVAATIDLPKYKNLANYDQWFGLNVQAAVVNEVLGPLSWRPTDAKAGGPSALETAKSGSTRSSSSNSVSTSSVKSSSNQPAKRPSFPRRPSLFGPPQTALPAYAVASHNPIGHQYGFQSNIKAIKNQQFHGAGWQPVAVYDFTKHHRFY